jgi:hypothetical protein
MMTVYSLVYLRMQWISGEISGSHGGEYEDVFWVVATYSLVDVYRRFRGARRL